MAAVILQECEGNTYETKMRAMPLTKKDKRNRFEDSRRTFGIVKRSRQLTTPEIHGIFAFFGGAPAVLFNPLCSLGPVCSSKGQAHPSTGITYPTSYHRPSNQRFFSLWTFLVSSLSQVLSLSTMNKWNERLLYGGYSYPLLLLRPNWGWSMLYHIHHRDAGVSRPKKSGSLLTLPIRLLRKSHYRTKRFQSTRPWACARKTRPYPKVHTNASASHQLAWKNLRQRVVRRSTCEFHAMQIYSEMEQVPFAYINTGREMLLR